MKNVIEVMLKKYDCNTLEDYTNALKEIIQEITLLALWRSKFFENAAFYGGTALRIFHQLNRFSEDLDFSLLKKNPQFKLDRYNEAIVSELKSFGFETEIISKQKEIKTNIETIVLKANTKLQLLNIAAPFEIMNTIHSDKKITIKMEVDIDPPLNFNTESRILINPIPFEISIFQLPDLFATKIHAILCRKWQTRVKGRDWFDLIWYLSQSIPVNTKHLQTRLIKNGTLDTNVNFEEKDVVDLLINKINDTDFELAKQDVMPFIADYQSLSLWSKKFFLTIIKNIKFL